MKKLKYRTVSMPSIHCVLITNNAAIANNTGFELNVVLVFITYNTIAIEEIARMIMMIE